MKRVLKHPEPGLAEKTGPRYWRSLDELADNPAFKKYVEREFPEGASELNDVDRRHFFKIMGASFALGGFTLAGCRRPEARILAYAKTPEHTIPGLPLYFASAFPMRKRALPIVVETHSGRPTKIEGNPSYLPGGGATNLHAQASLLDLYDPDRSTAHKKDGASVSKAQVFDFLAGVGRRFTQSGGAGLAFLAEETSSPTRKRLVRELKTKFPQAIWAEFEPVDDGASDRAVSALAGVAAKTTYAYDKAARVVSVDADFLGSEGGNTEHARAFTAGRRMANKGDAMNRLYAVESAMTLTGGMADHRFRASAGDMTAILAKLALATGVTDQPGLGALAEKAPIDAAWIEACAADLVEHGGSSLVVAGSHLPEAAHAIALVINEALGNIGKTVSVLETGEEETSTISDLADAIRAGGVQTLAILGGNPAYNSPADLEWSSLQKSVGEVVRLGCYEDETTEHADWHLSATHYLEAWGDARSLDGTLLPIQPMIMPLFGGLTEIEVLARILDDSTPDPYSQVLKTFSDFASVDTDAAFRKFLHDGLLADSQYKTFSGSVQGGGIPSLTGLRVQPVALSGDNLEVRFTTDAKIDDGRFNNNGWLQECPDPISKITWDNAIGVSPRLAGELGVVAKGSGPQIIRQNPNSFERGIEVAPWAKVTIDGRSVEGPIHIQPGLANYTILLPLGYGRTKTGRIGTDAGFSAYAVRSSTTPSFAAGASIELIPGKSFNLANTQEHWSMEGRAIVREANLGAYESNPHFVDEMGAESHSPPIYGRDKDLSLTEKVAATPRGNSLYEHPNFDGTHQWGMSIDLNTCTGCNACVVACQAENNIPIVGRDQVRRGREMHWIRLDLYYSDGKTEGGAFGGANNSIIPEEPQVSVQPIACMHCETAPCETVCPVNATVHDEEGLNLMAYNRCVGTRYCANNCPYKVRRFNFFDFNQRQLDSLYLGPLGPKGMPDIVQMAKNPDVTVRMRGVMEKCTYCIQRIQQGKIEQKVKARDTANVVVPDGTIKVACEQACPTDAIVFGNILDPESAVSKAKANDRDYSLLGYLNARPRTTYMARLRNPNKNMPDYYDQPLSKVEYDNKNPHGEHGAAAHGEDPHHNEAASGSEGGHH